MFLIDTVTLSELRRRQRDLSVWRIILPTLQINDLNRQC
jgi:hypothetical protein